MNGRIFFNFIFLILLFTSCGVKDTPARREGPKIHEASVTMDTPVPDKIPYTVYAKAKKYSLTLYEPGEGRYAGAYILSDDVSEIEDFEKIAGEHSVYLYDIRIGDIFPIRWLLSCLANTRTPYIVINPPNGYDPYNIEALTELADEIGRFYVPVFVDLYPNPDLAKYDPEEYKAFFREAHDMFQKRASNAAIVFSVAHDAPESAYLYYPGDDYADWAGINVRIGAGESVEDVLKNIDGIYYRFQKEKPVTVSLAVSHISGKNHVYRTKEASLALRGFYGNIISRYPRVKGINYININCIEKDASYSNQDLGCDNYLITDETLLLDAYRSAVSDGVFVKAIDYKSHNDISEEYFISPFPAYLYENEIYISANTIYYDLNIKGFGASGGDKAVFEDEAYYNMKLLEKNGFKNIRVDDNERIIYLDEP